MKTLCAAFIFVSSLAAFSVATASPASDLLEQGVQFMSSNYHGYSTVKPLELGARLQAELEQTCAGNANCPLETATPFLQRLASGMNDGHTYYLTPSNYQRTLQEFSGAASNPNSSYGFQIGESNSRNEVLIEDVIADSPAFKGGLRPFDRVVSVGTERLAQNAVARFRALIQTDSAVKLSVVRGDPRLPARATVTMQRRKLEKTNLPFLYRPAGVPSGTLVMRFPTFVGSNDIAPRAHALVAEAQRLRAKNIVIDLRGNGGGEETECYGASSAFVGRAVNINETVAQQVLVGFDGGRFIGNDPQDPNRFEISKPALWQGGVAMLVDNQTASCGELMAYIIQQKKRGLVIGSQTYGVLDTATEFWKLINGSALAITYVRTINEDGTRVPEFVTPDITASFDPRAIGETGTDAMLELAIQTLNTPKVALMPRLPALLEPLVGFGERGL
jgi:carboxyl-terminal processing protease